MAEGSKIGLQGNVPQDGNSTITGNSSTLDILTLQQDAAYTGDYLVGQTTAGTEMFSISSAGAPTFAGDMTLSSGLAVTKAATFSSTVSVANTLSAASGAVIGKAATFSSTVSIANTLSCASGVSVASIVSLAKPPVIAGGTVALASNVSSVAITDANLTTKHVIIIGGVADLGSRAAIGYTSAGGATVQLVNSVGSAVTLSYVAFATA